ncbi:Prophage PSPPH06, putative tail sheath protein, partial [Pseudomonas amygdali pv. lachrymans]
MALGKVCVNNLNLGQGAVTEIERYFLFIGPAAKNVGKLVLLDTQSDLDVQLGVPDSDLKTQILAARSNG